MATWQSQERTSALGECRQCRGFCDKLIEPRGCMEIGCRFLYSYEDIRTGQRFMGLRSRRIKPCCHTHVWAFAACSMSG